MLPALLERLRERDWSEKDIEEFNGEAHRYAWELPVSRQGSRESCADTVALALTYMKGREDTNGLNENAGLQARLAYELMQTAREMAMHGYAEQVMTRMALNGTRDVMDTMGEQNRAMTSRDNASPNAPADANGDMTREMLRARARTFEHKQVKLQTQENRASRSGGSVGSMQGSGGDAQQGWLSGGARKPDGPAGAGSGGSAGSGAPGGKK